MLNRAGAIDVVGRRRAIEGAPDTPAGSNQRLQFLQETGINQAGIAEPRASKKPRFERQVGRPAAMSVQMVREDIEHDANVRPEVARGFQLK
jgi:hypothetical protein